MHAPPPPTHTHSHGVLGTKKFPENTAVLLLVASGGAIGNMEEAGGGTLSPELSDGLKMFTYSRTSVENQVHRDVIKLY